MSSHASIMGAAAPASKPARSKKAKADKGAEGEAEQEQAAAS